MGCGASKVVDDSALVKNWLVKKCRERKRLMKNAVDYRYKLSNSHVAYFHSLKDMGHALSRIVDEQLDIPPSSAVVKPMPPSGSNSILSSDFQPEETRGSVDDAVLTSLMPPYAILTSDDNNVHIDDQCPPTAAAFYMKNSAPTTTDYYLKKSAPAA
uniref:nitrate regulatory gene2 protein-like n=1 Tax=Erigeron canadensis TaxID=72917 RepID=UPI001CB997E8